jgi:cystathionine beta-lyase/cystathionine gamma-synthase
VRLSIGLESPPDIVADLWEGIEAVRKDKVGATA